MFGLVELAIPIAALAGKAILHTHVATNIFKGARKEIYCVLRSLRAARNPEYLNLVLFSCPFEESEISLYIIRLDIVLLRVIVFIEGQLVSDHWIGLLFRIPTPRASLPINDMNFAIRCFKHKVDKPFKLCLLIDIFSNRLIQPLFH